MEMYKNTEENIITISYELGFIGETFFFQNLLSVDPRVWIEK